MIACLCHRINNNNNKKRYCDIKSRSTVFFYSVKKTDFHSFMFTYIKKLFIRDDNVEFSAAMAPVFSVAWPFKNHSVMLIC